MEISRHAEGITEILQEFLRHFIDPQKCVDQVLIVVD